MDCPRCSVELSEIAREGGALHRCAECGGLWVADVTDMNKILLHANLPAMSSIAGYVNAEEITGLCPACNVEMVVVEGGERRALSYDTCESCGGIWVDDDDEDEPPPELGAQAAEAKIVAFFRKFAKKR